MQYAQSDKTVKHKNGVGSQFVIDDLYKNADRDNYELPPPNRTLYPGEQDAPWHIAIFFLRIF